ncbi:MAG: tetratricopeptide repeat protein, partial [Planctomycetota bacterium]|nr:tetratricopeptide repeat protein [Planctomycetota bacterium]
ERVKQRVTFQSLNLLTDNIPGTSTRAMDLIVCRNVFIYFKQQHVAQVAGKLADSLRVGGYLLTGHGELHGLDLGPLERTIVDNVVVYRKTESPRLPPRGTKMPDVSPASTASSPLRTHAAPPLVQNEATVDQQVEPALTETAAEASTVIAAIEELLDRGHGRAALERAQQAAAVCPQTAQLDYLMARAHADLGQHDHAIDACQRAIAADAFAVQPHYLLAHIAEEQGRFEDATSLLKKVIYLDPSHLDAHLSLAAHCQRQGDLPQATRLRRAAIALLQAMPEDTPVGGAGGMTAGRLIRHLQETATNA